jgi:site-specific DNA-methyltransferase (adenine-specific)
MRILVGDARAKLRTLPAESVDCCVTSPPYFGLRDYGVAGQIGLEKTPDAFVASLVEVFREVRRVLKPEGTCWLNLGDSYAAKSLVGIPWRVAFALQADGWYLRSDIIWQKPNAMPSSVTDRPTTAHEYVFLLSKSRKYFYDADAIREPLADGSDAKCLRKSPRKWTAETFNVARLSGNMAKGEIPCNPAGRNKRSVWTVATKPYKGAHFATFPPKLIEPCILAGSPRGGLVLDPFNGAGTTGVVALQHGRDYIGIELNPEYAQMARERIAGAAPLAKAA